jgi:hypothetical protein
MKDYRWLLWHWSGKARDFRPLDAPPPPAHRAYAAGRAEALEMRWWDGNDVWRYEAPGGALWARKFSHEGMQALQRCVLMEVEGG